MIWLAFAVAAAVALGLCGLVRTRYGNLRLRELPGFLFILLAGKHQREQAREILARRRQRPALAPRSGMPLTGSVSVPPRYGTLRCRLWSPEDYDMYMAAAPVADPHGALLSEAITAGLLVNLGIGKPRKMGAR